MLKLVSASKTLSEFTKKYSLSKTLRFELKPVAETKNHLKKFIDLDTKRAKDYKELKKIVDEYHKVYIEAVLSAPNILNEEELKEFYNLWSIKNNKENKDLLDKINEKYNFKLKKNYGNKEVIEKMENHFRKQIVEKFKNSTQFLKDFFDQADIENLKSFLESFDKNLHKEFIKNEDRSLLASYLEKPKESKKDFLEEVIFKKEFIKHILPVWLKKSSLKDKEQKIQTVKEFNSWTSYLQGFYENRKNMYSDKEQGTAIVHRIINENLIKFFGNLQSYEKIKSNHQELQQSFEEIKSELQKEFDYFQVENIDDLFQIKLFNKCLSQTGIDHYNTLLGGKTLESGKKFKGINEYINLYKQRKNKEHKDKNIKIKYSNKNLPVMELLYKQILSDTKSHSFVLDEFHNKKELIHSIQSFSDFLFKREKNKESNLLEKIKELFTKDLPKEELSNIYIKQSEISGISNHLFGDWDIINSALRESFEKTKSAKKKESKKDFYSFKEIDESLKAYLPEHDNWHSQTESPDISQENLPALYFRYLFYQGTDNLEKLFWKLSDNTDKNQLLKSIKEAFSKFKEQALTDSTTEFKPEEVKAIQNYLDQLMRLFHLINKFYLEKDKKKVLDLEKNKNFYNKLEDYRESLLSIIKIYNKSRNFITSIDKSKKKIKINFEDSALLDGWDINKETAHLAVLFKKKEDTFWKYYLGVMNKEHPKNSAGLFNYHIKEDDKDKAKNNKEKLRNKILHKSEDENFYEKMNYKLLPNPSKMLPKVFFSKKNLSYFNPSPEIIKIKKDKTYAKNDGKDFSKKDCHKFIDFYKECLKKHKEWNHFFNFKFSPTSDYNDISDFFSEVKNQGYKLSFDKIKSSYIEEKMQTRELLLFEIYNKDLSTKSKNRATSKDNLHTLYFKGLFKEENLKNLVLKLNGQAEIFYRKAPFSKKRQVIHAKNQAIKNKNLNNPKETSIFKYDLIKDKRFYEDKFFFHFPISLNFKARNTKPASFNQEVLKTLNNNKNINVIGIDRGERHLAYYTVINQNRKILEQGSFNKMTYSYKNNEGETIEVEKDYHELLDSKEKERDKNRKEWKKIHNIKELKAGYLSHLVYKIAQLKIKHNAIVVFEDLNFGFKRGRFKFEKQIYQKLEKALIDKLNYLVFKDKPAEEPGGYLNAYQLTAPFESFQKMGKQTGFLFYTPAYYTSKVCPLTGFTNLIYPKYEPIKKSQEFFKKFDKISFDQQKDFFVFEYQDSKFCNKDKISFKNWKVCTLQEERYKWDFKNRKFEKINVTQRLKDLFKEHKINYSQAENLKSVIIDKDKKDFFIKLIDCLRVTLQLRYINPDSKDEKEQDFILSPVADESGRFFDSRKTTEQEPKNADANGAYHIALKGLMTLQGITKTKDEKFNIPKIKNKEWFKFLQKKKFKKAS